MLKSEIVTLSDTLSCYVTFQNKNPPETILKPLKKLCLFAPLQTTKKISNGIITKTNNNR